MKRLFLFTMMCLFGLFSSLSAQNTMDLVIGENAAQYSSGQMPFYTYYNYSISQQIYTADELLGISSSTISSVAYKQYDASGSKTRNISVYMVNTTKEGFDGYDWIPVQSTDMVFSGTVNTPSVKDEWMNIALQTPFQYTGGNLLICVVDNTGSWVNAPSFYTYDAGATKRAMYAYRDTYAYDPSNPGVSGILPGTSYYGGNGVNSLVKLNLTIPADFSSLKVTPETIDLGDRPNGAWMRPTPVTIGSKAANLNINAVETSNSYFKLPAVDYPVQVTTNEALELDITHGEGQGTMEGILAVSYGNAREFKQVDITAFAYDPTEGDVWEEAKAITAYPFTETPDLAVTYDNYQLPGNGADGRDVVYEINVEEDVLLNANVAGADGKIAVYTEDFAGEAGPMVANNYEGPEVGYAPIPAASKFNFDFESAANSLVGMHSVDADGDTYGWTTSYYWFGSWGLAHDSYFSAMSLSYVDYYGALTPDNYLCTNEKYAIFPESEVSFWVATAMEYPEEHYGLAVSTDGENFTTIYEETYGEWNGGDRNRDEEDGLSDWKEVRVSLADYAGQEVYIAVRHFGCTDQYALFVDDVKLSKGGAKRSSAIADMVLPAGKYYVAASSTSDFTVNVNAETIPVPEKPYAPTPANYAQGITDPSLSWTFGAYTVEYQVLFGTTFPPKDVYVDWTNNLEIGHVIRDLYNNKNYFWQVNARNTSGTTYGDIWAFTTTFNVPQDLALTNANLYEGESTVLSWNAVSDRSYRGYNVYVNGEKVNNAIVTETSFELKDLAYNMNGHQVCVTAVYDEGESAMSEAAYVYVTGMTEVVGNIYEQDGVTPIAGGSVTLNGTDEIGNPASYTFTIDETGAFGGEILAGTYTATAIVDLYQNGVVDFVARYDETAVVAISMIEVFNPVKYVNARLINTSDVEDPDQPEDPEDPDVIQYRFKSNSTGKYLHAFNNTEHQSGPFGGVGVANYAESNSQIFTLEAVGAQFYLRTLDGYYVKCWDWNVDAYSTTDKTLLGVVDAGYGDGSFYIQNTNNNKYFKVEYVADSGETFVFGDCTGDCQETWTLEVVNSKRAEDANGVEVTWGMQYYGGAGEDFESGSFDANEWNNTISEYPWAITTEAYEGEYAMKSTCELVDYGVSAIEISVEVPYDGFVGFYYKVSSEQGYDLGKFYIDGEEKATFSGEIDWTFRKVAVTEGTHTYKWEYAKDIMWESGADAFYIDNIEFYFEPEPFTGGWLTYDDGVYATSIGTGSQSPCYWGVMFPASAEYAGCTISKVAVYDAAPDYAGTYTANIYVGGDNAPGTLVSSQAATLTGTGNFVEIELTEPVALDGTQTFWITFYTADITYPAAACGFVGDLNSDWISLDGITWEHASVAYGLPYSWMVRAYLDSAAKGQRVVFSQASKAPKFEGGASTGTFVALEGVTPKYVGVPANETETSNATRALSAYNVYRKDVVRGEQVMLSEHLNDTAYVDNTWSTIEASVYQWGVQAYYEGNRAAEETEVINEGFEGGMIPENWTTINEGTSVTAPWVVQTLSNNGNFAPFAGTYAAYAHGSSAGGNYYLVTPEIDSDGLELATISFNYINPSWAGDYNYLQVAIASSAEGPWTTVWETTDETSTWTQATVEIEGYEETELYIAFVSVDEWGFCCAIDNVVVTTMINKGGSEIVWSKPLEKDMSTTVAVNVTTNNGDPVAGTKVTFTNLVEEGVVFTTTLDESGAYTFNNFRKGDYELVIEKSGFASDVRTVEIWDNSLFTCELVEDLAAVEGLYVSPTGWAMWQGKGIGSGAEFAYSFDEGLDGWTTIDGNGDGHNWYHSSECETYHSVLVAEPHTGAGHICTESFCNGLGALNPDDYIVTPEKVAIGGSSVLKFWASAQDDAWSAEHFGVAVSEAGNTSAADFTTIAEWTYGQSKGNGQTRQTRQTAWTQYEVDLSDYAGKEVYIALRHFNITDMFMLLVDDVELTSGGKEGKALSYYEVKLDDAVVASQLTVPYFQHTDLVDGTEYTTTVTAVYTSGPSEAMEYTWTKVDDAIFAPVKELEATLAGESVELTWVMPSAEPDPTPGETYSYDFEDGMEGWTTINANGDDHTWYHVSEIDVHYTLPADSHNGTGHLCSESYCNATWASMTPDDYVVSPQKYAMTADSKVTFWACSQDSDYSAEHFGVAVSTAGNTSASDFATISEWTIGAKKEGAKETRRGTRGSQTTWVQYTVDLSAYAGQEAWVAIRHFNCSDQFILLVDDIEVTTGAGGDDPVPPVDGLTWGFEGGMEGWTTINANGDDHTWYHVSEIDVHYTLPADSHNGTGHLCSESYCNATWASMSPDDYVVAPQQIAVAAGTTFSFWASSQDSDYQAEHFGVAVSTAGNTSASDFTTISEWTIGAKKEVSEKATKRGTRGSQTTWTKYTADLSAYAGQNVWVAIRHFNCNDQFILLVDDVEVATGSKETRDGMWAYYDNGQYEDGIGGPASFSWGIKVRATDIEGYGSLTKISAYDRLATSGTFDIFLGGDNAPAGASVHNQAYTFTASNDFVEIALTEAVATNGQNVWIIFNTNDGANFPAAECNNTGDADGRWITLDGSVWEDVTAYGLDATWMIRGYFEEGGAPDPDPDPEDNIAPIAEMLGVMIYRDGELLTSKPVAGTTYTDKNGTNGAEYCVKVVYGGEMDETYYAMSAPRCAEAGVNIDCVAPQDLFAEQTGISEVTLKLSYNPNPVGEWLYYDNGTNEDAIGGPESFQWGIMFPSSMLAQFEGSNFTKVSLFDYAASSGDIKIYYGGSSAPQDLIHSQPYSVSGTGQFVEFDLTAALPIDPTMNVWVTFTTSQGASFPAAVCANTGDANGRWISLDGSVWEDITAYGLSNTWMMRAYVTNAKGEVSSLTPMVDEGFTATGGEVAVAGKARATSELSHYNVYRGTSATNMSVIGEATTKTYVDTNVAEGTYYYAMTAVYEEGGETCESEPANAYGSDETYVVVEVTAIDENGVKGMMIYPNPTKDNVTISAEGIERIVVTNALGQVMLDQIVNSDNEVLNMAQYEAGVYMVRIVTANGVAVERITVIK